MSWRRVRKRAWSIGFYLLVLIAILVALFPFYWILRTSLSTNADIARGTEATGLFPSHLSTGAYSQDFNQQHFLTPLINSAIVALAATVITVVVATMAGYALARLPIRGSCSPGSSPCWRWSVRCSCCSATSASSTASIR
jgi:trehalose/maltose transport system permease protein